MAKLAPYTGTSKKYVTDAHSVDYSSLEKENEDRRRALAQQAQQGQMAEQNRTPVGMTDPAAAAKPGGSVQMPEQDRYNTSFGGLQGNQAAVTQQDVNQDPGRNVGYDPVAAQLGAVGGDQAAGGLATQQGYLTGTQQDFANVDPNQAAAADPAGAGGPAVEQGGDLEPLVWQNLHDILSMERRDTSQAEDAANWRATGDMRQLMGRMGAAGFGASGAMGRMGGMIESDRQKMLSDINRQADLDLFGQQTAALGAQLPYQQEQSREDREQMIYDILMGELNPEEAAGGGEGGGEEKPFGSDFAQAIGIDSEFTDPEGFDQTEAGFEEGGLMGGGKGLVGDFLDAQRLQVARATPDGGAALSPEEGAQLAEQGWTPQGGQRRRLLDGKTYQIYQSPDDPGVTVAVLV